MTRSLCLALTIIGAAITPGSFAQENGKSPKGLPFSRQGTEAGLGSSVESFLNLASAIADDTEVFEAFCRQYRIDPSWPSSNRLGVALVDVNSEYKIRMRQASGVAVEQSGPGPDEWRHEAIGRLFGELYEELRLDGYDMELKPFLLIIQANMGPSFVTYSDKPFTSERKAREEALFWKGLKEASMHARLLQEEGGVR